MRFYKLRPLEIIEIVQLGSVLFILAMMASFLISLIFTEIDKAIDNMDDGSGKTIVVFIETYFQLIITTIAYFYIEKVIYIFPSIATTLNKNYPTLKSANYVIHIILILVLIEMNGSLKHGLHTISEKLNITRH